MKPVTVFCALRTGRGLNNREHPFARHRRTKKEKRLIRWALASIPKQRPPVTVLLTRHAPGNGLDSDNLQGALKSTRDAVADYLETDDRDETSVRYFYDQVKQAKHWGVEVTFTEAKSNEQLSSKTNSLET